MMEYKDAIKIDPDRLDREFLRQTELLAEYGRLLAEAKEETRKAEQQRKLIRSRLILRAKNGDAEEETGTKKPSDAVCEAFYRTSREHIDASEEYIQAQSTEDHLQQAVYTISARKGILENMVRLLLNEYFTGPIEPFTDLNTFDYDTFERTSKKKEAARKETTTRLAEKTRKRRPK